MSQWEDLNMTAKIENILRELRYDPPNHFGQPFISTYQIAIEFVERYADDFKQLGYPLGGAGTGQHSSFAQYIARELSQRIKSHKIDSIEGAWLHKKYVRQLSFHHNIKPIETSGGNEASLSMFRLIEGNE